MVLARKDKGVRGVLLELGRNKVVYLLCLMVLAYYFIFCYIPMYGVLIAFMQYSPRKGILGSEWVGLKYFKEYFTGPYFWRTLSNTFIISLYDMIVCFPAPIVLALMLNEVRSSAYKRTVQTLTYLPYFISAVVISGIIRDFVESDGVVGSMFASITGNKLNMLSIPEYFRSILIASNLWTTVGWGSIIYLSALTSIDPGLYDAASIDGAGRFRKIWHVSLPGISNIVIIMLILRAGSLLSVNGEMILLLYNPVTYQTSDVISTYVYRRGLLDGAYSFSTAVSLFNSAVNFILLVVVNKISNKVASFGLW